MPRAPNAEPSADALRKREARAKKKAEDPEGYARKISEASQAYRDKKGAERAAAAPPPPDAGGAQARKALAECREKVCDEVAEKLGEFYSAAIKSAEEAKEAAPALKAAAVVSAVKNDMRVGVGLVEHVHESCHPFRGSDQHLRKTPLDCL